MADETTPDRPDDDEPVTEPDDRDATDATPADSSEADEHDAAEDHDDGNELDDAEGDSAETDPGGLGSASAAWDRVLLSHRNLATFGQLILHHEARDVVLVTDGDAALRVIELHRRRNSPVASARLEDPFDPEHSPATHGWLCLDLEDPRLIAISWVPSLASTRPRTVIDPVAV